MPVLPARGTCPRSFLLEVADEEMEAQRIVAGEADMVPRRSVVLLRQMPHRLVALGARATWASGIGATGCHAVAFPGPPGRDSSGELFIQETG